MAENKSYHFTLFRSLDRCVIVGRMEAQIWPDRVDIFNAHLPKGAWDILLDDLKAEHAPALTPHGKRMFVSVGPAGEIRATAYRTAGMSDSQIAAVLEKHGILVKSAGTKDDHEAK